MSKSKVQIKYKIRITKNFKHEVICHSFDIDSPLVHHFVRTLTFVLYPFFILLQREGKCLGHLLPLRSALSFHGCR